MKLLSLSILFLFVSTTLRAESVTSKIIDLRGRIEVFTNNNQLDTLRCDYADDETQWYTFKTIANTIPGSTPLHRTYLCVNEKKVKMVVMFFKWEPCDCLVLYSNTVQGSKILVSAVLPSELELIVENNKYPLTFKKPEGGF